MDRRDVLSAGAWLGGALLAAPAVSAVSRRAFPKRFYWGSATAAYQIEGAVAVDGRGTSIWDTFSRTPGKVKNGDTGDVACDSYNRWREDIALMKRLGFNSYRFSIAWPRIQATGSGAANQRGLDHYRRFVDALLQVGIRPLVTLYHWDLPQPLEDAGGWPNRELVGRFADYATIMGRALGDRVDDWVTLNEPAAFVGLGYLDGAHAPGRKDPLAYLRATHTVNLAHAASVRALKAVRSGIKVGSAVNVSPIVPATNSAADQAAAKRYDASYNMWFTTPTVTGRYPVGVLPPDRQEQLLGWQAGDEARLREPLDFMGINYYAPVTAAHDAGPSAIPGLHVKADWAKLPDNTRYPRTDFDWIVYPDGLRAILKRMAEINGGVPLEITENGASYGDAPGPDGRVRDVRRTEYYRGHLNAVARAIAEGVPVRGYHAWSLLDNFEWAAGYDQRFGIVHVDFAKGQKRTVKDSALWYADHIRAMRR